jgi:hypothetical protein
LQTRKRIIVEDVQESTAFNQDVRKLQLEAGVRAVQATPLFSKSGEPLGVFSTHYKRPWMPTGAILRTLDSFARLVVCALDVRK